MTVTVSHLRDWVRPERTERRRVPWGIGCTARELAPEWAEPDDPLVGCSRNGSPVTDWDAQLTDGDHLHFWARPGFKDVGLLASAAAFLFAPVGGALFWFGALGLVSRLILPNKKPVEPGDESSSSYAFRPQGNARGEGVAIPRVYGRFRSVPVCINEQVRSSIDANGQPLSEYLALYLISSGPIYAIGDKLADGGPFTTEAGNALDTLEINDQPASNFSGVEAHVRLGNFEQEAIAEFAEPVLQFAVDKTLRESALTHATTANDAPSGTTAIATAGSAGGVGDPAGANVTKWDAEEIYVAEDDADEFTVVLHFPQGLVAYDSGNAAVANSVIYQIRYREVDGTGTPFGNYAILPAEQRTLTRGTEVRLESRHRFYAPASYSPPVTGKYVESRATGIGNPGLRNNVSGSFLPAAPADLQFSFSTWVRRRNAQASSTTNRLFDWFNAGTQEGFRINLVRTSGTAVNFLLGTGGATTTLSVSGPNGFAATDLATDVTFMHQLVVTYEARFDGANSRARFYWDGVLRGTVVTASQAVLDQTQIIRLMSDSHTAPTLGYDGHLDETTLWSRTLTAYEVASMFNGGAPQAVDAAAAGLIIGGRFDSGVGSSPNLGTAAFGPYATAANWILGSGTNAASDPIISAPAGIVKTPATGTVSRGKYQVEVMRLDAEDTVLTARSEVAFEQIQLRTFEQFEYPGMALLAVKVPATDQISGGAPKVTVRVDGALVPVWDGVDPVYPNMPLAYSRNPAWIDADILTDEISGLGAVYRPSDLDVAQFKALADHSDALIYDNLGRLAFQTAAYRDSAAEAVTFAIDTTTGLPFNLGALYGDVVRYRTATLPSNFPQVTTEATGKVIKPILTGLSPAAPAWLSTQAGLAPQEVVFVEFNSGVFYIYTRTTQALGAGQTVYTVSGGQTDDNGLEVRDVRARFDGVFDRQDFSAWDAVVQVLQTARAAPIRIGSRISVFIDDVAQPAALFTMASMVQGSWRQGFMGVGDRFNAESADISDELLDYKRSPVEDEHPSVNEAGGESSLRKRRISIEGITRRGQAKRYMRRDLNMYYLARRWCSFAVGIDGITIIPGQIVDVSHDVPQYGFSGLIYSDSTNTTVKLDREVTIAPATGYEIQVQDTASSARYTVTVTHAAGTYAAGTALTTAAFPASFAPSKNDQYAFGQAGINAKSYRVVETTLDPQGFTKRFRCVEYVPEAYDDEFGTLSTTSPSALPIPSAPVVPAGVENLTASEVTTRGPDGAVRISARVEFSHMPETYTSVGGAEVYLSAGDSFASAEHKAHLDARSTTVTIEHAFQRGQSYRVWVVPVSRDGSTAYHAFASWIAFRPKGLVPVVAAPTVSASINGESVVYEVEDVDGELDHGAVIELRRGGWILGQPVAVIPAQARTSGALPAWAGSTANSKGVATPPIYARVKLRTGQYSEASMLEFEPAVAGEGNALEFSEEEVGW